MDLYIRVTNGKKFYFSVHLAIRFPTTLETRKTRMKYKYVCCSATMVHDTSNTKKQNLLLETNNITKKDVIFSTVL